MDKLKDEANTIKKPSIKLCASKSSQENQRRAFCYYLCLYIENSLGENNAEHSMGSTTLGIHHRGSYSSRFVSLYHQILDILKE